MSSDQENSSSSTSGVEDVGSKSSENEINYKAKYIGQQKAYDREHASLVAKQNELDTIHTLHEQELSTLRGELNTNKTRVQELDALHKSEKERADREAAKSERLTKKQEKRVEIADKYPALLELFDTDDLKERDQFQDDDSYIKYLDRQAARFGQVVASNNSTQTQSQVFNPQQNSQFRVPATGATVRVNTNSSARNEAAVKAEIQNTSPSLPKYWELLDELEALKVK